MSVQSLPENWQAPRLGGTHVSLEALTLEHVPGLQQALEGDALSRLWYTNVPKQADAGVWVSVALEKHAQGIEVPFVVRDGNGTVVGSTRFYDVDGSVPKLSIG